MTRARDIANLVDANGDIVAGALDNVPAADVVNDTTPQLGGNLDAQTFDITNVGNVGIGLGSPNNTLEIKSTTNDNGIRLSNNVGSYYHLVRSNGDGLLFDADAGNTGGGGADIRFQIKGSEKARLNASGDMGIGVTSVVNPSNRTALQVSGGTQGGGIYFGTSTTDTENSRVVSDSSGGVYIATATTGGAPIAFYTGNAERMKIDSSGRVTMPAQPLSIIGTSVNNYAPSAGDVLQFDYVSVNRGSAYNTSTYAYSCPVAGDYEVSLYFNRYGWMGDLKLEKNGASVRYLELRTHGLNASSSANWQPEQFSFIISCSANDTLRWKCDGVYTSLGIGALLDGYNNHLFDTVTYRLVG